MCRPKRISADIDSRKYRAGCRIERTASISPDQVRAERGLSAAISQSSSETMHASSGKYAPGRRGGQDQRPRFWTHLNATDTVRVPIIDMDLRNDSGKRPCMAKLQILREYPCR